MKFLQIILFLIILNGCASNNLSEFGNYCPDCKEWLPQWRGGLCLDCVAFSKKVLTSTARPTMLYAESITTKQIITKKYDTN